VEGFCTTEGCHLGEKFGTGIRIEENPPSREKKAQSKKMEPKKREMKGEETLQVKKRKKKPFRKKTYQDQTGDREKV